MNQKKSQTPKKPIVFYYLISLVVLMMLNRFLFPSLLDQKKITEVDYTTFINHVENNDIEEVEITETEIKFSIKDESGELEYYSTGRMDHPALVDILLEKDIKQTKIVPEEMSPLLYYFLSLGLPMVLFFVLGPMLMRRMTKGMGGNAMSFGKSNAKVYVPADQDEKTFKDVAGQDEAKEALVEIVDFLHNPKKYADIGATMPKGALLVGPPGTGKTLLAKAVAGEAKVPFFSISGSDFVEMFVGLGAAKVRDLFKQAQDKAPCIVFIDEIDTIGKKRDGAGFGGNDEREQTLNQLLSEMDGFDGKKGVVILAATNRPESLDKALLRPGRFDRRIPVNLPDLKGREAILDVHAKKIKMEESIDFNEVARMTAGASGAELANIINEAALRAVRMGRNLVNQTDLVESVEVIIAGYQRKGAVIQEKEKKIIAYHEIGHALVAAKQTDSAPVTKITIIPRTSGALGYTMQVEEQENVLMSKEEILNKITTLIGGRAAEEVMFGSVTSGASNDIEKITRLARAMVTRLGMSDKFGMIALETVTNQYLGGDASLACSPETSALIDKEVQKIVKECYDKAIEILTENKDKLIELSNYLLEKETITGTEFMELLNKEDKKDSEGNKDIQDSIDDQDKVDVVEEENKIDIGKE
ncbi:ATP-dependent zinc metalloprotease FtsH [Tissierella sp. Yu-01]|uniref:ATP-dependent zinc metalloprotease FtsH n=1 Tax=Tissierella sp. Yu-01 TaxID=3035694 RepID=UPI00240D637A|nr:ATP-dependent zinc metalloprotease FtsH [Tissierella sp. Yu-01]WFA08234.1 ATP-dependent zinc metalloprotease FtsH [Tissierella sp. Yu-01]